MSLTQLPQPSWNQMFFFNLKQSPSKIPVVCQETQKLIDEYKRVTNSNIPNDPNQNQAKTENCRPISWMNLGAKTLDKILPNQQNI